MGLTAPAGQQECIKLLIDVHVVFQSIRVLLNIIKLLFSKHILAVS